MTDPALVLVVEDDRRMRAEIRMELQRAGHEVLEARDAAEARKALGKPVELVILDLGLPDEDGLTIAREIRASGSSVPILMLTARATPESRVAGLESGADDYLVKPFYMPELLLRVAGLLRRARGTKEPEKLCFGSLWLSPHRHAAGRGDREFELKRREFELLCFLMRNPGRPWTRLQLLQRVWGPDYDGTERTVDIHVRRLRQVVEEDPKDPRLIVTEYGIGYRFEGES